MRQRSRPGATIYLEGWESMRRLTWLGYFTATFTLSMGTALAQSAPPSAPAAQLPQPVAPAEPAPATAATQPAPVPPVSAQAPVASAQPAPAPVYYPAYQPYPASPAYVPPPPPPARPRQKSDVLIVSYNTSVGKGEKTLHYGNTTFTGTIATNLNLIPMLITGNYYFMTDQSGVRPYGGFGIGAYAADHRIDVGISTVSDASWHFGFAPELGVALPTGRRQIVFSTKFNYAAASGRWDPLMYLNFNLGVEL